MKRLRIIVSIVMGIVILVSGSMSGMFVEVSELSGLPPALPALNGLTVVDVPRSGYSWKKTDLTYTFANCPGSLDCAQAYEAIRQAFNIWDEATMLAFTEAAEGGDILITWGEGDVAGLYPFDGQGGKVAQTAYPYQGGNWWFDGDIFLDDSEVWVVSKPTKPFPRQVHLTSVVLHEIGHSLGLKHSNTKSSIMWPYYTGVRGLTQDAIAAVQSLYETP